MNYAKTYLLVSLNTMELEVCKHSSTSSVVLLGIGTCTHIDCSCSTASEQHTLYCHVEARSSCVATIVHVHVHMYKHMFCECKCTLYVVYACMCIIQGDVLVCLLSWLYM